MHDGVSFRVERGEVVALIGGSGTGKSVLLKEAIGLLRPTAGRIELLGQDISQADDAQMNALRRRFGMLFQDGALFSSLTVAENIAVPLREHTDIPEALIAPLVGFKLSLVGLAPDTGTKISCAAVGRHAQARGVGACARPGARDSCSWTSQPPASTRSARAHSTA